MIQWRNFNIDPDWYLGKIGVTEVGELLGVKQLMELIKDEFPKLQFGITILHRAHQRRLCYGFCALLTTGFLFTK
jgi:hypothetical protein